MRRSIGLPVAAVTLAACWMAGCQQPQRLVDPLPDPPMGALLPGARAPVSMASRTVVVRGPLSSSSQPNDVHRPAQSARPATGYRVVVDPGHGGRDPGAISVIGMYEKQINLVVATEAARLLKRRGIDVWLTRATDVYLTLEQRAAIANGRRAHLFVSVHADSAVNRSARGFTVYIARRASSESHRAAGAVERAMRTTGMDSRKIRKADYRVLVQTHGPAILVELGYLSNHREAALLAQPHFQKRLAEAVAQGICGYLGVRW